MIARIATPLRLPDAIAEPQKHGAPAKSKPKADWRCNSGGAPRTHLKAGETAYSWPIQWLGLTVPPDAL
jgi:hypothetical protein